MGLFSVFRSRNPTKVAEELVQGALRMDCDDEESRWIDALGLTAHRFIAERNMLRVGMTLGGVAFFHQRVGPSTALRELDDAVTESFTKYFSQLPDTSEGELFYRRGQARYIVRQPEETAGIFHYYLHHAEAWREMDARSTPASAIPDGFQLFVHGLMRKSMTAAVDRAEDVWRSRS